MSSSKPAAARWFVSDSEWAALNADYALVHENAAAVHRTLQEYNEDPPFKSYASYRDFLEDMKDRPSPFYVFTEGSLLFADVDQHNPRHQKQVLAWAKEPLLKTKAKDTITAETALLSVWGGRTTAENLVKSVMAWEGLRDVFVSYIMNADDKTHRQECLRVLSGQVLRPSPRPILMLVTMVDSTLAPAPASTEGWVCAYDFLANELIIKPFVAKQGHHPLGDPWSAATVPDGVSFRGSPAKLVKRFSTTVEIATWPNGGFSTVVYIRVAKWILRYWDALEVANTNAGGSDAMGEKDKSALVAAITTFKSELAGMDFPVPTTETVGGEVEKTDKGERVEGALFLQHYLEDEEDRFRLEALYGREFGPEGVGERIAGFWDELMGLVRAFNEDERNLLLARGWEEGERGRSLCSESEEDDEEGGGWRRV